MTCQVDLSAGADVVDRWLDAREERGWERGIHRRLQTIERLITGFGMGAHAW